MTELQGEQVEMENRGVSNEDDQSEKRDFERKLKDVLTEGDIDNMRDKLTPRALTKCKTNALLMAMEVNFELRRKAGKKGPDEEDLTKLANSVDEFTSCLLDPLKSKTEDRHAFGNSLDYLLDVGIEKEQRKFFAHPVMYNLMRKKWFGPFEKLKGSSWLEVGRWTWLFLNIWCLFDIILFPFLFTLFYIKHRINKVTRRSKEIDLAFVINATSDVADEAFKLMKNTIKYLMYKFKHRQVKYHILVHGEDSSSREICFTNESCDFRSLSDKVDQLTKNDNVNIPKLHENLKKVGEAFTLSKSKRPCSEKVLVLLTDHQTTREDKKHVEEEVKEVKNMGVNIVPVGMGPRIDIQELKKISGDAHKILHFGEYANPKTVGNSILHELQGKDLVESYREYFTTPYFVFIRDTLSYLTLLGLHFALCLETSSIPFSGLEWAILVFFLGRILMESRQFLDVKIQRKDQSATTTLRGSKYQSCSETEGEERRSATKAATLLKRCNKYLSDRWNILDFITILNYLVTFVLRVVTWSLSESVTDNRALVIAGYLYGLNTMFLTLRAFGHVMETVKGIGAIQIALFHIIGDITTIFWQFVAAILAFAIAITKVYMAERSFISNNNDTESACKSSSGFTCWWSMMKHLTWSLLGIAELDPLDSVDSASVTLVHFLYGAFLIMGVILLVNMMIALLSNTYQRVEDNSLKEWSFKKAITIQTYSTYHPIPVPLNLLSHFYLWIKWLCHKCRCCKWHSGNNSWNNNKHIKSLDDVVEKLHLTYFSSYGYSFPLTDERKMDHILQETERNRQMANQIAYTTFAAKGVNDDAFPTGPKAWQSQGIRVQGCLLTYEGSELCSTCKDDPAEYHGARYMFPFSPDSPHFEVLIQETGERRLLGVGVVGNDYGNHAMPGWFNGTVGYHIDDGKIFDAEHPTKGIEYEDAMAHRGDLIGCTVRFDLAKDGKVPVVFSLNGRQMTQNEISMDYTHNEKFLYPYIGMGYPGLRVLAKMSSCQDVKKVPNETQDKDLRTFIQNEELDLMSSCHDVKKGPNEIQDKDQIQKEELDLILETLEGMTNKLNSSVGEIKNAVSEVDDEVQNGNTRLSGLADQIVTSIQSLQDKIISTIKRKKVLGIPWGVPLFLPSKLHNCVMVDTVMCENISFLCKRDEKESIKEIRKRINDLDKTMEVKLKEVLTALQATAKNSQRQGDNQDEQRKNVQNKFHEHEEFIRTNLLELI